MAEIKLTDQQQAVVDNRGGALLISAAAGSGKTKVLIDRVLKQVSEEGCDLDDFLMITYTNAAAAELRGKLLTQLSELLAQNPNDRHLQKQMSRIYLTQISTVHAFCNKLLREYAHQLGLPPDFLMCDEQTVLPLRRKAMEQVMDRAYEDMETSAEIGAALDMLGAGRDDKRLPELIEKVYSSLQSYGDIEARLEELKTSLELSGVTDAGQTVWGSYLLEEFHAYVSSCEKTMTRVYEMASNVEELAPYALTFSEDLLLLQELKQAETWEQLSTKSYKFSTLKQAKKCTDAELKEKLKKMRDRVKEGINKRLGKFAVSSTEALETLRLNSAALKGLLILTENFCKAYSGEKRRRRMLDYNDLEHETMKLLVGKNGQPTQAALEISLRYAEIMVDEYQDTNAVQDAIFNAISKQGKNLFFVGDVKQSIYGFRRANPGIFLEKYHSFADYTQAKQGEPRKILLSHNFRSHPAILAAANDVFRLTMTQRVGGLRYGDAEALQAGAKMPKMPSPPVELHCIQMQNDDADIPVDKKDVEAEFVAERIEAMLQSGEQIPDGENFRSIEPEDIVILLRSMAGKAAVYMSALERRGINAVCAEDDLFEAEEIVILTSLLQVMDNPHQDIPLLSVLLSPICRFSTQTLAQLRGADRNADIFGLLQGAEEGRAFLMQLGELRDGAQELSMRELLEQIDEKMFFRSIFGAMENGSQRVSHLERFFALADSYEAAGNYGLPGFLRYLDSLKQKGVGGETAQAKGAVRIMTIHKSKGLEFPVVFLADLAKEFNLRDSMDSILVDEHLGIAAKAYDTVQRVSYATVARDAISHRKRQASISEEMRVLYVAMTRAKYRMVMSYCSPRLQSRLKSLAGSLTLPLDETVIEGVASVGDWVLLTALTRTEAGVLFEVAGNPQLAHVTEHPWRICCHERGGYVEKRQEVAAEEGGKAKKLPFLVKEYPFQEATEVPAKLTATQMKGRTLDAEAAEGAAPSKVELRFVQPCFTAGEKPLSSAQRGTAIHLAMQFIRYEACTDLAAVEKELDRLLRQGFLTAQQVAAVAPEKILRFFASDLGKRVLACKKVVREFKFSVLEDGAVLSDKLKGENLLLQGVTDCCLVEEDGLTILDFKSDRIAAGKEAQKAEYYRGQLDAYSRALGRIFRLPVKERILYFFATDTAYSI